MSILHGSPRTWGKGQRPSLQVTDRVKDSKSPTRRGRYLRPFSQSRCYVPSFQMMYQTDSTRFCHGDHLVETWYSVPTEHAHLHLTPHKASGSKVRPYPRSLFFLSQSIRALDLRFKHQNLSKMTLTSLFPVCPRFRSLPTPHLSPLFTHPILPKPQNTSPHLPSFPNSKIKPFLSALFHSEHDLGRSLTLILFPSTIYKLHHLINRINLKFPRICGAANIIYFTSRTGTPPSPPSILFLSVNIEANVTQRKQFNKKRSREGCPRPPPQIYSTFCLNPTPIPATFQASNLPPAPKTRNLNRWQAAMIILVAQFSLPVRFGWWRKTQSAKA